MEELGVKTSTCEFGLIHLNPYHPGETAAYLLDCPPVGTPTCSTPPGTESSPRPQCLPPTYERTKYHWALRKINSMRAGVKTNK